jgi:hypothetical protein
VGTLIKSQAQTIELAEVVKRLDELEARLRERGAI